MKRTRIFLCLSLLTGCAGLIGVPDLTLEDVPDASKDGGSVGDGMAHADGTATIPDANAKDGDVHPPGDAGQDGTIPPVDSATCDVSALATDALNCGRCGHSCLGGTCKAGMCDATLLGTVGGASFRYVIEHGTDLYVSTFWRGMGDHPGIYRIPKAGGQAVKIVSDAYVDQIAIVGETLYFIINDYTYDDAGDNGGVWSCDITTPAPGGGFCDRKLVELADNPFALTADPTSLYWTDYGNGEIRTRLVSTPAAPAEDSGTFRSIGTTDSKTYLFSMAVNNTDLYALGGVGDHAYVTHYQTDGGGTPDEIGRYTNTGADPGVVLDTATATFFTAKDYDTTTGGLVRRVKHADAPATQTTCSYGNATSNVRPNGLYLDGTTVFWTNLGDSTPPYENGSIAACPQVGDCCTSPTILWKGAGEAAGITGDASFLYWVTYRTGEIYKVARP